MRSNTVKVLGLSSRTFTILLIIAGCIVGGVLYFVWPSLPLGTWQLSVTPPTSVIELVGYRYPTLFLKTTDGKIYACETGKSSCVLSQEPSPVKTIFFCGDPNSLTPTTPGKVIDTLAIRDCGPDGYIDVHFALLEDSTVWEWSRGAGGFGDEIFLAFLMSTGALIGAVIGLTISRAKRKSLSQISSE